jgi:hypothetical protein
MGDGTGSLGGAELTADSEQGLRIMTDRVDKWTSVISGKFLENQ